LVPVADEVEEIERPSLASEDIVGAFGPHERLRIGVMAHQVVVDGVLEVGDAPEGAAPDALGCDLGEEPLDEVEPGGARRREVAGKARV